LRKLIPPFAALLACAALSAALSYAAAPKNLDRAIEVQRGLVAQRPADSAAANDLGSLLVLADDLTGAEEAYRSAIAIDGGNAAAHFNLGLLLQKVGDRRGALKEFKRALEIQPRHAWAQYQIGAVYHQQGHESAARKAYAKALALDPALGNPAVNPHLIDNELATSAMLYAYHHYREELQPERQFEEPARIAGVMIDRPGTAAEPAATPGEAAAGGGFVHGEGPPEDAGGGTPAENPPAVEKGEPLDDESPEGTASRTLSSKDLDPARASNQISGGTAPARAGAAARNPGGAITSGNRGRTRDLQQQPVRPTLRTLPNAGAPQQPPPPSTFLPTSDSTGMIETRLVEIDEWS
jgi:tetratricopeptide (TPR) repeat protein